MNKKAIRAVATAILGATLATRTRGKKIGFNMVPFYSDENWPDKTGHDCGTVACIAGWAHVLHGGRLTPTADISGGAQKALGLTDMQASALFAPAFGMRERATPQQAALVLFNLAETGRVDWRAV